MKQSKQNRRTRLDTSNGLPKRKKKRKKNKNTTSSHIKYHVCFLSPLTRIVYSIIIVSASQVAWNLYIASSNLVLITFCWIGALTIVPFWSLRKPSIGVMKSKIMVRGRAFSPYSFSEFIFSCYRISKPPSVALMHAMIGIFGSEECCDTT